MTGNIKCIILTSNLSVAGAAISATVAQLVEQVIRNDQVTGSTPAGGSDTQEISES